MTYVADLSKLRIDFTTFAPISIVATFISVAVSLWWDQIDTTFRLLQPYIAMSERPTPIRRGAGLTYRSKTWAGAAFKAARNRHWVLLVINIGSVLCQIRKSYIDQLVADANRSVTVSMSALFERKAINITQSTSTQLNLEIRDTSLSSSIGNISRVGLGMYHEILNDLLLDPPRNWLSGAAIQLSMNGSNLTWAYDGWSFIPMNLALTSDPKSREPLANASNAMVNHPINITVSTPAIHARLECKPIPEISNSSSWIHRLEKTDVRGQLSPGLLKEFDGHYTLNRLMFANSSSNTSVFANKNLIQCCSNETDGTPQTAALGYFSPVDVDHLFHANESWPRPFITKWIVGKPHEVVQANFSKSDPMASRLLLFEELPALQAAQCMPVIEMANSTVLIDQTTGMIRSYNITGPVKPALSAWKDAFTAQDLQNYPTNYSGPINLTTSYGVLFMNSMFNAADAYLSQINYGSLSEWLKDQAFVIHDHERGLNMDLMTYGMYNLANKDPKALLDYSTLVKYADRTIQTFFQHFIRNGLSLTEGGYAYQRIRGEGMEPLSSSLDAHGAVLTQPASTAQQDTKHTVDVLVSSRIEVLRMNRIATVLSIIILIWLIGTTVIVACLQRRYTGSMTRDIELIADVLLLIAGSDNLLRLLDERGANLKRDLEVETMLGWFIDSRGEVRWGVEVVGGKNAVQWVDAPEQGWHVREKSFLQRRLPWKQSQDQEVKDDLIQLPA